VRRTMLLLDDISSDVKWLKRARPFHRYSHIISCGLRTSLHMVREFGGTHSFHIWAGDFIFTAVSN
jgi:hypothetical protein